ncbi:hypothetical protein ASD36_21740 [Rhizobium sp. Root1334]|uniref:hypothetical protein n=1 Tax=unclassified Rhizobium TaxID=2613769 RepID=UPI00072750E0|nr:MULTISPECIES: hypothetical protein [unclassified Rhizobium]KQX98732.1 hypothetical protein ASD36_21740 [Rhizobium sp. Root1334]
MKRAVCAATISLMFLPTIVNAGDVTVRGVGTAHCGTWVENPELRRDYMQWVLGFVSATNYARWQNVPRQSAEIDLLNGIDANAVEVWMTNFCTQNQLQPIGIAAAVLVNQDFKPTLSSSIQ